MPDDIADPWGYGPDDASPLPPYRGVLKDIAVGGYAPPGYFDRLDASTDRVVMAWIPATFVREVAMDGEGDEATGYRWRRES